MERAWRTQALYGGLLILLCLFWGIGNPITKLTLQSITPFFCLAFRFSFAFLLFLALYYKKFIAAIRLDNAKEWLPVSLFTALAFIFGTLALDYANATTVGFLKALTVVFTPFLGYFLLKRPLYKRTLFVVAIVVLGMYFLCGNEGVFTFGLGETLALLSAATFAVALTLASKYVRNIGVEALSTAQAGMTAILTTIFAFMLEDYHILPQVPAGAWGGIVYLAIACTFLAYIIQNVSLRHVSAVFVTLAFCTEPIFTAIASRIILGERLTLMGLGGAALIIFGLVLAALIQNRKGEEDVPKLEERSA